jgi:RNA polymerase sigma-70 factor, ECF subfamily
MESTSTDASLIRRARGGDQAAATRIHARYERRLRGLARRRLNDELAPRVDPEDVVQSAMKSFFRAAIDGAYTVPKSGELWQLLAAITRHKVRRATVRHTAEKRDARRTSGGDAVRHLVGDDPRPAAELRMLVEEMLADYSVGERQVVHLRMEGHMVAQIAEQCARSKRTVERVLQEFRDELCERLGSSSGLAQ